MVSLALQQKSKFEGLALIGTPQRDASPSLLAVGVSLKPSNSAPAEEIPADGGGGNGPVLFAAGPSTVGHLTESALNTFSMIPLWIKSAIRLGTRFIRIAAASKPQAFPYKTFTEKPCCEDCGRSHQPSVDEYYFWLQDSHVFDTKDAQQDADLGASSAVDSTTDWDSPDNLPGLLYWSFEPLIHLHWTRVHGGRLCPPRRCEEGIRIDTLPGNLFLDLIGRNLDSLILTVVNVNTPSNSTPGFRYDIPTDTAVVIPQLKPDVFPPSSLPRSLAAYPWFVFFEPGKPLIPVTPFGTTLAIAGALHSNCQFESALKWCQVAFDPLKRDNTWAQCSKLPSETPRGITGARGNAAVAEHDGAENRLGVAGDGSTGARGSSGSTMNAREVLTPASSPAGTSDDRQLGMAHLELKRRNVPCCPTSTQNAPVLRGRAVFLEYLGILLDWADQLMGRNSAESFQQGLVVLNTMDRLLGSTPFTVKANDANSVSMTVQYFVASPPALNPRLLQLYDQVADRRSLIHNSENCARLRNGTQCKDPAAWATPRRWDVASPSVACDEVCYFPRCQPYRFNSILPKALELASMVKGLGASLMAAYERGDAEYLAALRGAQERTLLDLRLEISKNQWRAADWDVQALEESMQSALTRLRYYEGLIHAGNNGGEQAYVTGTDTSMQTQAGANVSEGFAEGFNLIPDMTVGVAGMGPLEANSIPIGVKMAKAASCAARIMNTLGSIASSSAGLSLTQAGWQRRLEEWQHQVDVISIEIQQIKRQRLASRRRRDVALKELNNHQQQMEHSAEVQDFLRDKFTTHALDLYLQQETAVIYRQAFDLTLTTAREAQEAFRYERGEIHREFLTESLWDNLHDGLMAGERLELALRSMDRAYMESNCREYELIKRLSLRDQFPKDFQHLKRYGYCEIELQEWRFDRDYPGHYMRRIKSASISIACVAGPYTGIHCRLQLLSSQIRAQPLLHGKEAFCCDGKKEACGCGPDPYVIQRYGATEAIATSHGQEDSGLFELNFRDERYLPFEFSGAVSRWRIELPPENNMFDFTTLSDLIINLNYTAREGGKELRRKATARAQRHIPGDGLRLFDIRRDFPSAWPVFQIQDRKGCHFDFPLRLHRGMFPFLPGRHPIRITCLHVFIETHGLRSSEHCRLIYIPSGAVCKDDQFEVVCIVGGDNQCVYEGKLNVDLGSVDACPGEPMGMLRFPSTLNSVREAYLLCEYEVFDEEKKAHHGRVTKLRYSFQ
ncbi:putative Insecticidal toxin complex protein TccB2 [Lignoscripta atroalba]|nr:putative Insecticidal toxin complex protein TccB2 [Lignoscripta atroalba]